MEVAELTLHQTQKQQMWQKPESGINFKAPNLVVHFYQLGFTF